MVGGMEVESSDVLMAKTVCRDVSDAIGRSCGSRPKE